MDKIINHEGLALNAHYSLETIQGVSGLVLESRGGVAKRNADYNKALEIILFRLSALGVTYVSVNVISSHLRKAFPLFEERAVVQGNGSTQLSLTEFSSRALRLYIGRQQAQIKVNAHHKGGNGTKRILLYNPTIDHVLWEEIARGEIRKDNYLMTLSELTTSLTLYRARAESLCLDMASQPRGISRPKKQACTTNAYERDPKVRAWVLRQADGRCELCRDTPFLKDDQTPYLESHHIIPLAEGGADTIDNVVALCPNCHRELHHGARRRECRKKLFDTIERLLLPNRGGGMDGEMP